MSKLKYLISPDVELTTDYIGKAIMNFQTKELPLLNKLWNYYVGKQKITKKQATDVGKPNNIAMVNYCNEIVKTYNGYLTGLPITYSNDEFQDIIDILNYNDTTTEDNEYLKNALIYGRAFECNYLDEEGKQRFRLFNPKECLPIYSNALTEDLLYVVRFYKQELLEEQLEQYTIEVYGPDRIQKYKSDIGFASFQLIEDNPHFFNQCPVSVFSLNDDEESVFYQILTLQDSYNQLLSSGVDDVQAWADAYFVLKGVIADADALDSMKRDRVLMIDPDADAFYVTKDANHEQLKNLMETIDMQIHTISAMPNFVSKEFMAQSGEAIKYKLTGFENAAAGIENNMRKALQRRIELISSILSLLDTEEVWRDVQIKFTRNLPNSLDPVTVQDLIQYSSILPDVEVLRLIPFISDPDKVLEEKKKQQEEEMEMIEFNHGLEEENE